MLSIKKNAYVADLGTGTAVIPILMSAKASIPKIYAIEIQKEIADMARRSVAINNLQDKIEVLNINLNDSLSYIQKHSVDIITTNPPYMNKEKLLSSNDVMKISKNEIYCNIADIMRISSNLLKPNGKLYMIHRPSRLCDIFFEARKNNLEPKVMQMIYPKYDKPSNLVLLQFSKNSQPEIKLLEPLYVHNPDNSYTSSILDIYKKQNLDLE